MVAMSIASIIGLAAIGTFATLNRSLVKVQSESVASDDAKTLVDFLVSSLQGVGGGSVRPFMGVDVTNAAKCSATTTSVCVDSMTTFTTMPAAPSCTVASITNGKIELDQSTSDAQCCPFNNQHVVLTRGLDHIERVVSQTTPETAGNCALSVAAGAAPNLDTTTDLTRFVGGNLTPVVAATIALDPDAHVLTQTLRGVPDQVLVLADNVFDFQVQLAYDANPVDNRITDRGDTSDEWLYNDPTETALSNIPHATASELRMVGVSFVVGIRVSDKGFSNDVQVIGGKRFSVPGVYLRGANGRAYLRNLAVFF
jgi:hypothetical protein